MTISMFNCTLAFRAWCVGFAMIAAGALAPSISTAAPASYQCGAPLKSVVKMDIGEFSTSSKTFVNVPGAVVSVKIPKGKTGCIKVHFSANVSCSKTAKLDLCALIVTDNDSHDSRLYPASLSAEDDNPSAHAFEWVIPATAGTHSIRMKAVVLSNPTVMQINGWTMDVETTN